MTINGESLPTNAELWKILPKESEVESTTLMDGLLPALSGKGFGLRTIQVSIMIRNKRNDRTSLETTMSRVLAMFTGPVTLDFGLNRYATHFYGCLKSYSVKPIIKKRAQILILTLTGVAYTPWKYTNTMMRREAGDEGYEPYIENEITFHSSLDYRPCVVFIGTSACGQGRSSRLSGLFFNPVTGEDYKPAIDKDAFNRIDSVYIDGLTGSTGFGKTYYEDIYGNRLPDGVYADEMFVYHDKVDCRPIGQFADLPCYPLIKPGVNKIVVNEGSLTTGLAIELQIFDIWR